MALVPYANNGKTPVHIDGKTIIPGETRHVDETQVPGYGVSKESETVQAESNPLAEILLGNVPSVLAALPELTVEQLDELESLEGDAEKPRKSVLDAIENRRLEMAQAEVK